MGRLYMCAREEFDQDAISVPFTVFHNYGKVAKPDGFFDALRRSWSGACCREEQAQLRQADDYVRRKISFIW